MKKILSQLIIFTLIPFYAFGMTPEEIVAKDYVTDYSNILEPEQVLEISKKLNSIKENKNVDIAVVIIPNMSGDYIENFSVKLYEKLGLGTKEKDEGLLWLIVSEQRTMRLEVGYGLEPIITDSVAKRILNEVVSPFFLENDYVNGINEGVNEVLKSIEVGPTQEVKKNNFSDIFTIVIFVFIFGINILTWLFAIIARTKSWWLGGLAGFVISSPVFGFLLGLSLWTGGLVLFVTLIGFIFDYFISKNYKYWQAKIPLDINGQRWDETHHPSWWAGGTWGPGGGGFRSGGSGFGGFGGGGMSGGGGSSSSW